MVTNLNWVKALDADQRTASYASSVARTAYKHRNFKVAIDFQERAAAEYEACRSMYRHLFQQTVEINHD